MPLRFFFRIAIVLYWFTLTVEIIRYKEQNLALQELFYLYMTFNFRFYFTVCNNTTAFTLSPSMCFVELF